MEEENNLSNEYMMSARRLKCWDNYINPKSKTWGNAYRSALDAGYTNETSQSIGQANWFKNRMRRLGLLNKSEQVLEKTLTMDTTDETGREKADLVRVQADTAKFIAKTLGKDEGYTERSEVTGKDGNPIVFMPAELMEKYNLNTDMSSPSESNDSSLKNNITEVSTETEGV